MKSLFFLFFITLNCAVFSYGQTNDCNDSHLHAEMVTLNQTFENQGFKVDLMKTFSIVSKTYYPVPLTLEQGKLYQINYIVQDNFQNYDMILIDKNKKELFKLKIKSKKTKKNFSTQGLVAPYTGDYYLILTQKVKGTKQACAGISVMESMN